MPTQDTTAVREQAQAEIDAEARRAAVDAEKVRIRASRSLRRRLLDLLPFTITMKKRAKTP
jgi:hypothetical protein